MNLYPRLIALCAEHPELNRHRRRILGSCCQRPNDQKMRMKIEIFLVSMPEFRPLLESLLE